MRTGLIEDSFAAHWRLSRRKINGPSGRRLSRNRTAKAARIRIRAEKKAGELLRGAKRRASGTLVGITLRNWNPATRLLFLSDP